MTSNEFNEGLSKAVEESVKDKDVVIGLEKAISNGHYWEVANTLGCYYNLKGTSKNTVMACRCIIDTIRAHQGAKASESTTPTTVVFGTSGWRGIIGEDFTMLNVAKVVRGIVEMMQTDKFLEVNGYSDFSEVQKHGIVVFRDNRYMGDEFIAIAEKELASAGIKIFSAGECPTGVGSALVTELNAAGSINFTPSHNPMDYAGIKFNPADGGPAGPELTCIIEEKSNAYMQGAEFTSATTTPPADLCQVIDAKKIFTDFVLNKSTVFDLKKLREWLRNIKNDFAFVVDFMHGSSRGYIEAILGDDLVAELTTAGALKKINTDTDYSFHGVKPEPCAANQAPLIDVLKSMGKKYSLAVALDPDADRIRFADAQMDIDMNRFGAIAYASLLDRGIDGGIASTAPSSDFALEIAKIEGKEIFEMAVGFKNFREPLSQGKVVLAFEESDGITCTGHTLEKCALAGLLLALESMKNSEKNISEQYNELREKYGYFYPNKAGADVKGVSIEEWQEYKINVVETLQTKLYKVGDMIKIGSVDKEIASINVIDGLKVIFADKSWILLRPSGTEPKFRYYFELASKSALADEEKLMKEYEDAAAEILAEARKMVDQG